MLKLEYKTSTRPVDYQKALKSMEAAVVSCQDQAKNRIWFLEHSALYTAGVSASDDELLNDALPVYRTNRGGKFTYHGPGQRVVYLILNLKDLFFPKQPDVKSYVFFLEEIIIEILKDLGLVGLRVTGSPGVWVRVDQTAPLQKIAFIGIRIKRWIAYHGIAFNISPDLEHFKGIIPCGLKEYGITSLKELKKEMTETEFDNLFKKHFTTLLERGILCADL